MCFFLLEKFPVKKEPQKEHPDEQQTEYFVRPAKPVEQDKEPTKEVDSGNEKESEPDFQPETETEPYVSPVDFDGLWAVNTDIYAWLDIPGTEISYPVIQHPDDDLYYLRRNIKGKSDKNGTLFTQASYNSKDFSDPLTVIYGHNMNDGQMFGKLQSIYSSPESLKEHSEIVIYLPDRELHYYVFAGVPYDDRHLLYAYDFNNKRTFRLFFQEILSVRSLQAAFADDVAVSAGEKTIILSTCLHGNKNKRFLVCGKLIETIPLFNNENINGG